MYRRDKKNLAEDPKTTATVGEETISAALAAIKAASALRATALTDDDGMDDTF